MAGHASGKLNADKHSPASSARSTKRRMRGDALLDVKFSAEELSAERQAY